MRDQATIESPNPSRLCVHSMTLRPWTLEQCVRECVKAGVAGISPWVEHVEPIGVARAASLLADAGLRVPAYVRGGFFVHAEANERARAIDASRRLLDDAATLGAASLVIVPGANPHVPLADARVMVTDALAALVPHASDRAVRLGLEPLHPMFAADRACVTTLTDARRICESIGDPVLGVVVDVYHVWWDERLEAEIAELGRQARLFGFHVSDWVTPAGNVVADRAPLGAGCIPIRRIRAMMDDAGFDAMIEIEILSRRQWQRDPADVLAEVVTSWAAHA
jgi:sugar phosphate isomerase/epimerase